MIYKKEANFPYPLLTNTSDAYESAQFILDVELRENTNDYEFEVKITMDSVFIEDLIRKQQAEYILVIQSKDNKFYRLNPNQPFIKESKTRLSLSKRTTLQLLIQAKDKLSFKLNDDLNPFYDELKGEIIVPKAAVLGFSNCVTFNGSNEKPLELFEKKVDPDLKSEIKIELGAETIIIHYKDEKFQFHDSSVSANLNHPYVYMGLQKALYRFINTYAEDGEDMVELDSMEEPEGGLDVKLYQLMCSKMVRVLDLENIDEVISVISDQMVHKYTQVVRGLYTNEN